MATPFRDSGYRGDSRLGGEDGAGPSLIDDRMSNNSTSALKEDALWRSTTSLEPQQLEVNTSENPVREISNWVDLMDPYRHFSILVPRLALRNVGLLNAILTLSARHLSLKMQTTDGLAHTRSDAIQYYHSTLHYAQKAMQYESYNTSDELLATALIVSAYEMLDGSHRDWECHL